MSRSQAKPARRGFTLLEVLLALALTAVVLLIVATGVTVQSRAFSTSRARVERAQLARVLLHRMADDFRGALPPGKAAAGASQAQTSTSADESPATSQSDAAEGRSDSSGDEAARDKTAEAETEQAESQVDVGDGTASADTTLAGVYGEFGWLRIDVVRMVRSETASSGGSSSSEYTPKIKTIVYYVVTSEEAAVGAVSADSRQQPGGGLVRRELTRPEAVLAAEQGSLQYQDPSVTPLASEVRAVEFRYHDGSEWLESWDTATTGKLPKAIEIRLFLAPISTNPLGESGSAAGTSVGLDASPDAQYRLVVPMPLEEASPSTGSGAAEQSSSESSSGSTGSTSGSTGSTSADSGGEADPSGDTP